ncbi:hypothetical protein QKA_2137 [Clostridioides difficile DA00165]|nr:hypothetical protein QKA_2137 [Clostridioides difficile DA00165]
MEYSYSKMNLKKGDIVEVNLEKQANVILLDHINYVNLIKEIMITMVDLQRKIHVE